MENKTVELTARESVLLSVAIRGLGGSYVRARDASTTKDEKKKYNKYIDECISIALKLELAFGVVERKVTHSDGSETVYPSYAPRKKKS